MAATSPGSPAPLTFAVIGTGGIAHNHIRDFLATPGVTAVGFADPSAASLAAAARAFPGVPTFTDTETMLLKTRPDIVTICTPNKFHKENTLLALRHGAHVVCEKPLAMDVAEAEAMEAARAAAGKLGGINFSYRNNPAFRFARVYLQSHLGAKATPYAWRNDAALAGFGALGDLGVHMIDTARFISGLDYRRVVGLAQTLIPQKADATGALHPVTTDTNAAWLAELTGGVIATFETTQVAPGYGNYFRLELSGDRGTLAVHSEHSEELWLHAGSTLATYATWKTDLPLQKVPTDFTRTSGPTTPAAIVHALRGENVSFPTFADCVAAQRVLAAIHTSMQTEAWVAL
jgi:predicted dehydrogenase